MTVEFTLPFATAFAQKYPMENQTGPAGIKRLMRWAITPPQSYAVYLVGLFLMFGLSFYVGSMKPKNAVGLAPPPLSAPRN